MQMGTERPLPPSPPADRLGGAYLPVSLPGPEFAFLYPSPHTELAYCLLISAYKTKAPSCPHILLLVELAQGRNYNTKEGPTRRGAVMLACVLKIGTGEAVL